jgi:hypothetical protein
MPLGFVYVFLEEINVVSLPRCHRVRGGRLHKQASVPVGKNGHRVGGHREEKGGSCRAAAAAESEKDVCSSRCHIAKVPCVAGEKGRRNALSPRPRWSKKGRHRRAALPKWMLEKTSAKVHSTLWEREVLKCAV